MDNKVHSLEEMLEDSLRNLRDSLVQKESNADLSLPFNVNLCKNLGKYDLICMADANNQLYKEIQNIRIVTIDKKVANELEIPSFSRSTDHIWYQSDEFKSAYEDLNSTMDKILANVDEYTETMKGKGINIYSIPYLFIFYAKIINSCDLEGNPFKDYAGKPADFNGHTFSLFCKSKAMKKAFLNCISDFKEDEQDEPLRKLFGRDLLERQHIIRLRIERPQFYNVTMQVKEIKTPEILNEADLERSENIQKAYIDYTCSSYKVADILKLEDYLKEEVLGI